MIFGIIGSDVIECDELQTIEMKNKSNPKLDSFKSLEDTTYDNTFHPNRSSDVFDIDIIPTLEKRQQNQNSFAISAIKNIAFVFVGCALIFIVVFIAMNIYYRFDNKEEPTSSKNISTTFYTRNTKPEVTSPIPYQGNIQF